MCQEYCFATGVQTTMYSLYQTFQNEIYFIWNRAVHKEAVSQLTRTDILHTSLT